MSTLFAMFWATSVWALDERLFGDDDEGAPEYRPEHGTKWKELEAQLPEYPRPENLIEVDISDYNFPFMLLIDKNSLSVAADRIVRYTVVLRSSRGADNVSYEGIQCNQNRVKRYGFGSAGRMVPASNTEWRFIRRQRQDSHRNLLVKDFFCPLPMGNPEREILKKLERNSASSVMEFDDT